MLPTTFHFLRRSVRVSAISPDESPDDSPDDVYWPAAASSGSGELAAVSSAMLKSGRKSRT